MAASQDNYVPKFGNWGTEEHVPYSVYFDEARKRRNAAKINPNDIEQNQNTISGNLASTKTSTFKTETKSGAQNGLEDGDLRRPTKFGNWETEEHVPYSVYFDEARKRRNAAKINPNDTEQNQNTISGNLASTKTSTFKTETKSGAQNGLEDGALRRPTESPWYHHTVNIEVAISSLVHRPGRKMTTRQQNAVLDSRIGRSPISPWDRNYSTGCSQLRSVTEAAETTDHTAAVPKFGDWDESDPTLVDGYTHIFNKVREERLKGTRNVAAAAPGKPHYNDLKKHKNGDFKKCCCFPVPW